MLKAVFFSRRSIVFFGIVCVIAMATVSIWHTRGKAPPEHLETTGFFLVGALLNSAGMHGELPPVDRIRRECNIADDIYVDLIRGNWKLVRDPDFRILLSLRRGPLRVLGTTRTVRREDDLVFGRFGNPGDYISFDDVVFSDAISLQLWHNVMLGEKPDGFGNVIHLHSSGRMEFETKTGTYFHKVEGERVVLYQVSHQGNSTLETPLLIGEKVANGGVGIVHQI